MFERVSQNRCEKAIKVESTLDHFPDSDMMDPITWAKMTGDPIACANMTDPVTSADQQDGPDHWRKHDGSDPLCQHDGPSHQHGGPDHLCQPT